MTNDEFFDIGRVAYITGGVQEALAAKQALEKVVENANSLQQLKAEIWPSFADGMEFLLRGDCENALRFFNKVSAKLSAV
jgi:hypothetical protein